jgi:hypothetical protein
MTVERPNKNLVDMLYRNSYVYVAALNEWGDKTLFVHKDVVVGSLNMTAASMLHKTRTRLMEIAPTKKDLMLEAPKVILKPLLPKQYMMYLGELLNATADH